MNSITHHNQTLEQSEEFESAKKVPSHKHWRGLTQDIDREHSFEPLTIEGKLPNDINGTLYQNGTGLFASHDTKYGHIFDADGLVRGIRIQNGKAYGAAKLVQSEGLQAENNAGRMLFSGIGTDLQGWRAKLRRLNLVRQRKVPLKNTANTSVLMWQERLFALMEASLPTELDPNTLDTIGESTLNNAVLGAFSAHPHWVSERACGYSFGINPSGQNTFLDIYELPKTGQCKNIARAKLSWRPFGYVHDFIATPKHLIFFIPPMHLPTKNLLKFMTGSALYPLMDWKAELGTEVIIVPIDHPEKVTRFITEPFFPIHFANAYEQGDEIIVDYTHSPDTFLYDQLGSLHLGFSDKYYRGKFENRKKDTGVLRRARIDINSTAIDFDVVWPEYCEFPKINPSLQGSKNTFVYMVQSPSDAPIRAPIFTQIVKLNLETGQSSTLQLDDEQIPSEALFIRKQNAKEEDAGYLLSMVYDGHQHKSYLAIIDAQDIEAGPVAKLHLDQALPLSFHGMWCPSK
ncbi:hypothetical protein A9Q99_17455 [Gammaproteobacteria bacterium 45_16_T64]|nr:hypothetical protein A9Q99_17455 [Gammaproteobacteria bacterium 45_16_T64]